MYETARLGVSWAAMAANGAAPTAAAPPCVDPASIHASSFRLSVCADIPAIMADCLFPLTLRMPAKSSAKLGEMELTTDEEEAGGAAKFARQVVQR